MGEPVREPPTNEALTQEIVETPRADPLQDSLDTVAHSFHWLADQANRELDQLEKDLGRQDEDSLAAAVIESLLEVALLSGAGKCGQLIFNKLGGKPGVTEDFVKRTFGFGADAGFKRAKQQVAQGGDLAAFINAQKKGISAMYAADQKRFLHVGRHAISTVAQAQQLEEACSQGNMEDAARGHYEASRDVWVSSLAQARFGDASQGAEPRTNMSTQRMRDDANSAAPGWEPEHAPALESAVIGDSPGVLELGAVLPEIRQGVMNGKPEVRLAFLNGVNNTIRRQYEDVPVGEIGIPRQIVCSVAGDMPDFTINLDERGKRYGSLRHGQDAWLKARAGVAVPQNNSLEDVQREDEGLRLLLQELVVEGIKGKVI